MFGLMASSSTVRTPFTHAFPQLFPTQFAVCVCRWGLPARCACGGAPVQHPGQPSRLCASIGHP
uniref:Uncharacterized protein n=1 Tax=Anopheles dirus TaxID=7168 RepID=A0A182NFK6_9DIPT